MGHLRAQLQALEHLRAAQIHVAIAQPVLLGNLIVLDIQHEGRSFGAVEDGQLLAEDFDLAGGQVGIDGTLRAAANAALHLQHEFVTYPLGGGEDLRAVRIKHHLHETFPVAQINENDSAVIAAAVDPSVEVDVLIKVRFMEMTAVMAAHTDKIPAEFVEKLTE